MAKDRDGRDRDSDEAVSGQLKRPPLNQLDSDSQVSDHAQHPSASAQQSQPRTKTQKHVVGGATGGRLHARVPSSKALHRHHTSNTSAKLTRRQSSPSPDRGAGALTATNHRRALSDLKVSRDPSSTNLKKNSSHTNLARNKSSSDFSRKAKSAVQMRRSHSNPMVDRLKMAGGTKVHFNIGDDEEEDPEDGWVDASTSASPLLSRRASTISGGDQSVANPSSSANNSQSQSPPDVESAPVPPSGSTNAEKTTSHPDRETGTNLTSRILQRTSSYGAPPQMSRETAQARPPSLRQHSPDSGPSQGDTSSTLSGTPQTKDSIPPPSRSRDQLTSRYSVDISQGSSGGPGGSYFPEVQHEEMARPTTGNTVADAAPPRPRSLGNLSQVRKGNMEEVARRQSAAQEELNVTEADEVYPRGIVAGARQRRDRDSVVPRNMNRTQQKLNLERASSSLETNHPHPHPGLGMGLAGAAAAAGPLVGGSGYESRDPRIAKLLERTDKEYQVVRRYQNPIARSLNRLAQLPGANKSRHIPRPGTSQSSRASTLAWSQNGGERDVRDYREPRDPSIASLGPHHARRPTTPQRSHSTTRASGGFGPALDADDDPSRMHEVQGLSGASLVDGQEDAGTAALLRALWDKNLDLGSSQD